jgi:hypothetical protein
MDKIISSQVCGLMAQQLAEAQAEIVKQEGVVRALKQAIIEAKTAVVKNAVKGRLFKFSGMRMKVLEMFVDETDAGMLIQLFLGAEPKSVLQKYQLTKAEQRCMNVYEDAYKNSYLQGDQSFAKTAIRAGEKLRRLKNKLELIRVAWQNIDYSEALDPKFLKGTGIRTNEFRGISPDPVMLDDLKIDYCW